MEINLATIDFNPGQGGGGEAVISSLSVTSNGVYRVPQGVDGYNPVTVNVPAPEFVTESLSVSVNGTYTPGTGVDGYSQVTVNVPEPEMFGVFYDLSTITKINSGAFSKSNNPLNSYITTVNLPNCTSIGDYAFYDCTNLSELSLPLCTYIGGSTFRGTNITSLNLPVCSYIGYIAFALCNNLSQVSLPVCEYLGSGALRGTNIETLTLPKCTSIGVYALSIPTLRKLVIETSTMCSLLSYNAIVTPNISIYVPASLVNVYKADSEWSHFSSKIFPIE